MTTLRQAAEQALEALEHVEAVYRLNVVKDGEPSSTLENLQVNITALRQALEAEQQASVKDSLTAHAEQQDEPVAEVSIKVAGPKTVVDMEWGDLLHGLPAGNYKLYTRPQPAQQPLTKEQIDSAFAAARKNGMHLTAYEAARAIERAHGIGGEE